MAGQFRLEFRTGPEEPTCSESHGQTNFHEAKFTAHIGCDEKPAHSASKIAALKVNRSRHEHFCSIISFQLSVTLDKLEPASLSGHRMLQQE